MHEKRSAHFARLFDDLGIKYQRTGSDHIDNTYPLQFKHRSLQLYFHEADHKSQAYFSASENLYRGYNWKQYWLHPSVDKVESGHVIVIPILGEEQSALLDLIQYSEHVHR